MPTLKLLIDRETLDSLEERARLDLRHADQEAIVILRQALGLQVPYDAEAVRKQVEAYAQERNQAEITRRL